MNKTFQTALIGTFCLISGCAGGNLEADDSASTLPETPRDVTVVERTENSLTFSWAPAENALEYGWKLLKGMTLAQNGVCPSAEVTVSGLESGTKYNFSVKAVNGGKSSAYSAILEASTLASGDTDGDEDDPVETPDPIADVYQAMKMPAAEDEDDLVRAFPGAEGGGMFTTGGRGGRRLSRHDA